MLSCHPEARTTEGVSERSFDSQRVDAQRDKDSAVIADNGVEFAPELSDSGLEILSGLEPDGLAGWDVGDFAGCVEHEPHLGTVEVDRTAARARFAQRPVEAVQVAERLRHSIACMPFQVFDKEISVTVSIGVATQDENTTDLETLIARADQAMYIAKHKGRNRVAMSK